MNTEYVPLWTKSNFSFLEGASHPEELVEQAHALGLDAIALTDRNGVYGMVEAHMKAKELGVKLIVGAQIAISFDSRSADAAELPTPTPQPPTPSGAGVIPLGPRQSVVLLAQTRLGYGHLCQLLSKAQAGTAKGDAEATLADLREHSQDLIALCPDPAGLAPLQPHFENRLYALCARHRHFDEAPHEKALREAAQCLAIPVVASNEVLYHHRRRKTLQDALVCIRHSLALAKAGRTLKPNAEHDLKTDTALRALFADDLDALRRTRDIAERCTFSLADLDYRYPVEDKDSNALRELTFAGALQRYPGRIPAAVRTQLDRELQLIRTLDYDGYFLTMHAIVQFCRAQHILCQGRGSAANSAVCYCLGITAIDPVRMDLLFERFLSLERAEPPDIDLDIEHQRREEVIQWVYERYGRRHAAMVANVIRYRPRSALRDVGKVLDVSPTALDKLCKLMSAHGAGLDAQALEHAGFQGDNHTLFLNLATELQETPRHLSIHPGGFILGREPVDTLVPIEPATMPGRTVIQWDKYAVDDLRLFKVDLLGLGALTHIHQCLDLITTHEGNKLELHTIPQEDPDTYAMVTRADTVGVFQIESRAQMNMLPRLKPKTFYDLVIEVAIVRPGPIQGDMVHPYLKRRSGQESAVYPHPALERVLKKTLGVPLFQEQVMKIAVLVGGYTPGEADRLRRDMAAWRRSGRIERHHERLVTRMREHGIEAAFAERIFSQIRGFGEYGFPESHAASFALIAYATAWLRCHHKVAFTCALLNAQPMGFYVPSTIVEDAKRHGVEVKPIDVQHSRWDCTLEDGAVRMGLRYVKGLGEHYRGNLEARSPPYESLAHFAATTALPLPALSAVAESGAFASFGSRRDMLWAVRELHAQRHDTLETPALTSQARFSDLAQHELVTWDYRSSYHSTRGHPLAALRSTLTQRRIPTARDLQHLPDGKRTDYVGLTICRQRPGTASGVVFYTLEDETGFVNLVVWRQIFERYPVLARTAALLGVSGRIQSDDGVVHLIADKLWDPPWVIPVDGTQTRSFH